MSLAAHTALCLWIVWSAGRGVPGGAAERSSREVGIVLRRQPVQALDDSSPDELPAADSPPAEAAMGPPLDLDAAAPADAASPFAELMQRLTTPEPGPSALFDAPRADPGPGGGGTTSQRLAAAGQTRVTVFGVEGVGRRFVYAFDRSISMSGPPLSAAKRQLVESLAALGPQHQFQVLFFNNAVTAFDLTGGQRRVAFATEENKRLAARYVDGITADLGTDRYEALVRALAYRPDVVFFLTDADLEMSPAEIAKIAARCEGQTRVSTIEFGRGPQPAEKNFLVALAAATGGDYGYVDTTRLPTR